MSLFTMEEICMDCKLAHWHICEECYNGQKKFCHCEDNHETSTDYIRGECEYKELEWRNG